MSQGVLQPAQIQHKMKWWPFGATIPMLNRTQIKNSYLYSYYLLQKKQPYISVGKITTRCYKQLTVNREEGYEIQTSTEVFPVTFRKWDQWRKGLDLPMHTRSIKPYIP